MVLWGAYVRASGSGAGCGSHWPLCNGEVVPVAPRIETIIEFTHRVMSGVALVGVTALWLWSRASFARGSRVRRMAVASFVLLITEALLGAGLVLFNYVDKDASIGRAFYLSLHLVNTLLLLGALVLTAWFSRGVVPTPARRSSLVVATLPIAILVSVTGAIAALGDTLFPATSLAQGFHRGFSAGRRQFPSAAAHLASGASDSCGRAISSLCPLWSCDRSSSLGWPAACAIGVLILRAGATRRGRHQPASAGAGLDADHAPAAGGPVWIGLVLLAVEATAAIWWHC